MVPLSPCLEPCPRSFHHRNRTNPRMSWFAKFERHCVLGATPSPMNYLIGDSTIERLCRSPLLPLSQSKLPHWENFGIGGDRAEHVHWRAQYGGMPDNPSKCIISMGTNNIRTSNYKECMSIANTITNTIDYLLGKYPNIAIAVVGILPREHADKCRAAVTINNILNFRLPSKSNTTFIMPPAILYAADGTPNIKFYESDLVHLNERGYRVLLDSLSAFTGTPHHCRSIHANPVIDDFGIGQPELLGKVRRVPPPPPSPPTSSSPPPPCSPPLDESGLEKRPLYLDIYMMIKVWPKCYSFVLKQCIGM